MKNFNTYIQKKDYKKALELIKIELNKDPSNNEGLYLLALLQDRTGDYNSAIINLKKIKKIKDNPIYLKLLGKIYLKISKFEESKENFIYLKNNFDPDSEIENFLGIISARQNNENHAIEHFKRSSELNSKFIDPIYNLMEIFEKKNDLENLKKITNNSLKDDPKNKIFLFYSSIVYEKDEKIEEAIQIINSLNFDTNNEWVIKSKNKLASLYEKKKKFKLAFSLYKESNNLLLNNINRKNFINNSFLKQITEIKNNKINYINKNENFISKIDFTLVFLIGFPRSGTTLLDAILSSHSKIKILEEKPLVQSTINNIKKNQINKSSKDYKEQVETYYLNNLKKYIDIKSIEGGVFIDKLPLNIVNINFIYQLFPKAKFIFSLRHPLDSILSCYKQNFVLNSAMINFLELNRISEIYNIAMSIFKDSYPKITNRLFIIKYENLVLNKNYEIKQVLNFLNISWEKNINLYRKNLSNKERIRTPSYNQVTKKLYKTSINRWKCYKIELKAIIPKVSEWIKYFNY